MEMVHAHKGYLQTDGRLISTDNLSVEIPMDKLITVLWDVAPIETKTKSQKQRAVFEKFFIDIDDIDDEPITDEDMTYLQQNRANFTREVAL